MAGKVTVGILSLGCPRNLVDSERILGRLSLKRYRIVDIAKADVAIVNTCSFIEDAKKESIDAILDLIELKKEGRIRKIIVSGCLAQRYGLELAKELPEVDAVVGRISLEAYRDSYPITPSHYAYLKICEGCVHYCSYCVIPHLKGKFVTLDRKLVLAEASRLNDSGIQELNIIGQDITGYGFERYDKFRLPDLLKKILKVTPDIPWIRLLYLYPGSVVNELLDIMASDGRVCKYIDLPIQHSNDRIIRLMNRRTNEKQIRLLIENVRKKMPGVAIRTSCIVGFPSETDAEFHDLLDFIKEMRFERLGAFMYSREEGTPAYSFEHQVPHAIKAARLNEVMAVQQDIAREVNARFLGATLDVMIEEEEDGGYIGRSQFDAPEVDGCVYVSSDRKLKIGDILPVTIHDTLEYDLVGKALNR
ncbi:MAG TPA: MiaB/RimO family radical SAM methylthiotransferase [Candidatus Omnitrophota bacterium]|nr:MiaB/RimO family radical SAM methylthiotransferase [Candidatus Omnitrophota bacterium]HPT06715.1 MiaB/RimO family radical SAM methylthiotransferase [Candidatus Omnitrophota bacterium]